MQKDVDNFVTIFPVEIHINRHNCVIFTFFNQLYTGAATCIGALVSFMFAPLGIAPFL